MPRNFTGTSIASCTATTTPPRAVPSSFVTTRPVTGTAAANDLRLLHRVLTDRAVEHEQRLVRRAGQPLGDHARDFLELVHQPFARVQPTRRVDDQHVDAARDRRVDRVERDGGRIGARLRRRRTPRPSAPPTRAADRSRRRERCRPRRPSRACLLARKRCAQLADERRLARSVHADDENDRRRRRRASRAADRCCPPRSAASIPSASARWNSVCVFTRPRVGAPLDFFDEPQRDRHAEVGLEQQSARAARANPPRRRRARARRRP